MARATPGESLAANRGKAKSHSPAGAGLFVRTLTKGGRAPAHLLGAAGPLALRPTKTEVFAYTYRRSACPTELAPMS
jgi:hypothetical protein